jgi:hypothetical protein
MVPSTLINLLLFTAIGLKDTILDSVNLKLNYLTVFESPSVVKDAWRQATNLFLWFNRPSLTEALVGGTIPYTARVCRMVCMLHTPRPRVRGTVLFN